MLPTDLPLLCSLLAFFVASSFPFLLLNVYGCLAFMRIYATYACSDLRSQQRGEEPLGLELQTVVSSHVDSGNQTLVLQRVSSALKLLTHHSRPSASLVIQPRPTILEWTFPHQSLIKTMYHRHVPQSSVRRQVRFLFLVDTVLW